MKTAKEIKEWLSPKSMYDSDLNRIVGYLEGQGYDLDNIFPLDKKVKQEPMSSLVYDKFKEWIESDNIDTTKFLSSGDMSDAMAILLHTLDEDWTVTETNEIKVNKPKFKINDLVARKNDPNKKAYRITKIVHKRGKPRYNATSVDHDSFMCQVRESKIEEYVEPKTPYELVRNNLHKGGVVATIECQQRVTELSETFDRDSGFTTTITFVDGTTVTTPNLDVITWCNIKD